MSAKDLWSVGYKWKVGDATRYGHTVVSAPSQREAEAKFARQTPHVTVPPLDEWRRERDAAEKDSIP